MIFNGTYTLVNLEKETHRTFQIKTAGDNSKLAGKRIISLLTGSNNETDYTGIGFVNDNDTVYVWKSKQGTEFEKLGKFFQTAVTTDKFNDRVTVKLSKRCIRCNRKLTTPEAIEDGIGSVCKARLGL